MKIDLDPVMNWINDKRYGIKMRRREYYTNDHLWFAWRPVRIGESRKFVWLEYVYRSRKWYETEFYRSHCIPAHYGPWQYRVLQ